MLGALRLILALLVALSHTGVTLGGLNPGVVAVVGFYLISGYVMGGLISRYYSAHGSAPVFYLDRALRLLPQYLFYALIALLWYLYTGSTTAFLTVSPGTMDYLNNLLIVPLNYYMFNGSDRFTLIPPAWSLGAEIQYYLLAPFLYRWRRLMLGVGALGLGVFLAACGGVIQTDWFGYRLLPGVLLFFVLGMHLQRCHQSQLAWRARATVLVVVVLAALALGLLHWQGALHQPYNLETLLGLMVGLLLLHLLARRQRQPWDDLAGDLSYGVFLNHFLILWVIYPHGVNAAAVPGFIALSLAASWLSQRFVERPILGLRYRLRSNPAAPRNPKAL